MTNVKDLLPYPPDLAAAIKIRQATVQMWIKKNAIPTKHIKSLAAHLKMNPEDLKAFTPELRKPDTTSVRSLIVQPSKLAEDLGIAVASIQRWFKVERLPAAQILKIARFYNVSVQDLMHLTGSDKSHSSKTAKKPRDTLPMLIKVYEGKVDAKAAAMLLGLREVDINQIIKARGPQLQALYDAILGVELGTMTVAEAASNLGITKLAFHSLRKRYGFAPGPLHGPKAPSDGLGLVDKKRLEYRELAYSALLGTPATQLAERHFVSTRTIFRTIKDVSPLTIQDLAAFPDSFKQAYVEGLKRNLDDFPSKWLDIAHKNGWKVSKRIKKLHATTKTPTIQKMAGILLGDTFIEDLGGEPTIWANIFSAQIRPVFDLTWDQLMSLLMTHQMAFGEMLLWWDEALGREIA